MRIAGLAITKGPKFISPIGHVLPPGLALTFRHIHLRADIERRWQVLGRCRIFLSYGQKEARKEERVGTHFYTGASDVFLAKLDLHGGVSRSGKEQ